MQLHHQRFSLSLLLLSPRFHTRDLILWLLQFYRTYYIHFSFKSILWFTVMLWLLLFSLCTHTYIICTFFIHSFIHSHSLSLSHSVCLARIHGYFSCFKHCAMKQCKQPIPFTLLCHTKRSMSFDFHVCHCVYVCECSSALHYVYCAIDSSCRNSMAGKSKISQHTL